MHEFQKTRVELTFNNFTQIFMMRWMGAQMDKWVGPDFETGLANLTALSEEEAIARGVAEQMTMQPVTPMVTETK